MTEQNPDTANTSEEAVAEIDDMSTALNASLGGMTQLLDRLNASERQKQAYAEAVGDGQYTADLRRAFDEYQQVEQFEPGDLVQWKPLLRNRPYPADGAPAIVIRYLSATGATDADEQSEALNLELGFLDGDQAFLVFAYASGRFTRWVD